VCCWNARHADIVVRHRRSWHSTTARRQRRKTPAATYRPTCEINDVRIVAEAETFELHRAEPFPHDVLTYKPTRCVLCSVLSRHLFGEGIPNQESNPHSVQTGEIFPKKFKSQLLLQKKTRSFHRPIESLIIGLYKTEAIVALYHWYKSMQSVVNACVSSIYSVHCVTAYLYNRLQSVLNAAARSIAGLRHYRHIRQFSLVEGPGAYSVQAGDNRKSFTERYGSSYLAADLCCLSDIPSRRRLRSSLTDQLDVHQSQCSTVGDRTFTVAGARL